MASGCDHPKHFANKLVRLENKKITPIYMGPRLNPKGPGRMTVSKDSTIMVASSMRQFIAACKVSFWDPDWPLKKASAEGVGKRTSCKVLDLVANIEEISVDFSTADSKFEMRAGNCFGTHKCGGSFDYAAAVERAGCHRGLWNVRS